MGDAVELRVDRHVNNTVVTSVDQDAHTVRVAHSDKSLALFDMYSLACFGTHKRAREWAAVDRELEDSPPIPPNPPNVYDVLHPCLHRATAHSQAGQLEVCRVTPCGAGRLEVVVHTLRVWYAEHARA